METQPMIGFTELLIHIVGDMAHALSEREGESEQQRLLRVQTAAQTIIAFRPGDAIEAMIAGHCVMFHEMIVDSVRDSLRGDADPGRRAARGNIVAMDKAFGNNLVRLEQYRTRVAEAAAEAREAEAPEAPAETAIEERVRRHQSPRPSARPRTPAADADRTVLPYPSPEVGAAPDLLTRPPNPGEDQEPIVPLRRHASP